MENLKCKNCKMDITCNDEICPYCGTVQKQSVNSLASKPIKHSNLKDAKVSLGVSVLGLLIILFYRAWLGTPIYLVGFYLALKNMRSEYEADGGTLEEFLKNAIQSDDLGTKIMIWICITAPIVLIFAFFMWLIGDTERAYDAAMRAAGY